ncbi:MAG: feruloyl-CoA synthase [Betaproteobacteria bacterium]
MKLFGPQNAVAERRSDGAILLRVREQLGPYPPHLLERLRHWAAAAPDRVLFAQRDASGGWRTLKYAEALQRARTIGQFLLSMHLSAERPLVVLSGNDIEHALLHLGALYVGVPYAPVSPAYSLLSTDFAKLRYIRDLLTPGLVFANGPQFRKALGIFEGIELLERFEDSLKEKATKDADDAHARIGPDTITKFLFTSGSTGAPKAVINTHRMWCSNQAMIASMFVYFREEPPVIVDWAPWHHTAAGSHDFGMVIYNGGSYYLDEGKPMPGAIEATVRNLREIAPTWYFNVPKGFEALLPYLREDEVLRKNFFSRLRVLWFAGAAIAQHVYDEMRELARATRGEPVPFLTGLGSTETAPYAMGRMWETDDATNMGLPPPGEEMKLAPLPDGKYEVRLKGPHITPGYWRQPELTARAFDHEGYYHLGDAFVLADENDPQAGLLFRGRIAEDFKLDTGTFVNVGPLRARFIEHFAPLARDVVFAGENRGEVGALIFPAGNFSREEILSRLKTLQSTGSSNRVARAMILEEPPSLDRGEMTDKGSINQRAVLASRRDLVEELYRGSERVLLA